MNSGHGDGKGPSGDRGPAAIVAIFQHHHFTRLHSMPRRGRKINLGVRLAVRDIFRREHEAEAVAELKAIEHVIDGTCVGCWWRCQPEFWPCRAASNSSSPGMGASFVSKMAVKITSDSARWLPASRRRACGARS